jgi:primosomal protein N' (replication factor Y)
LKLSSETVYTTKDLAVELTPNERSVVDVILEKDRGMGVMSKDIQHALPKGSIHSTLKNLLKKNAIASFEEVKEKFIPKRVSYVTVGENGNTDEQLQHHFSALEKRNADKQIQVLMTFLQMSKWDGTTGESVKKKELEIQSKTDASAISALVKKGILAIEERSELRMVTGDHELLPLPVLSELQKTAFEKIKSHAGVTLLHGVTSSGKTEVYLHLMQEQIQQGRQVLLLVPEIALTSHLIDRIQKYFGTRVGVYHSGYSTHERTEVWHRVHSDLHRFDVVLAARSGVFLPFENLGLIIVDEEHEGTFKQQDPAPRYHARDTAIKLSVLSNAQVVLGSATPSLESYFNAKQNKYQLVEMFERYGNAVQPKIDFVNLRSELQGKRMQGVFSSVLLEAIDGTVKAGKQVILFQNRRGYTPLWECEMCHYTPECKNCDVSLTYHKFHHELRCHYCGHHEIPVQQCPSCGANAFKMLGAGTERIEEELGECLPHIRISRMDLDVARGKHAHHKIISEFESGKTDVLIGTQMVTKGLDFSNVHLVGILNADRMLKHPDFRSIERAFQMMVQVSGRSGRREERGRVLIQTYDPEHWVFPLIENNNYEQFYTLEVAERKQFRYPPFTRMIKLTIKHKEQGVALSAAAELGTWFFKSLFGNYTGPETPAIGRVNNYYIQQFWIRIPQELPPPQLKRYLLDCSHALTSQQKYKMVRVSIDVDPM